MKAEETLRSIGLKIPEIHLPASRVDLKKWAVIACDQFTSEPSYWREVERIVDGEPSTYHMILPESDLESPEKDAKIDRIRKTMEYYRSEDILVSAGSGGMLVKRSTPFSPDRWGLVAALDLEHYDFTPGSVSLIRATEKTILERIPPRRAIREDAVFELPHIMVLIDDPEHTVIRPLADAYGGLDEKYSFPLMLGGGHVSGFFLPPGKAWEQIGGALTALADPADFESKYGATDPLLFAMGDGNHSLATAKTVWEDLKESLPGDVFEEHPARWALVEIVNLYDPGLVFHPIHRILSRIRTESLMEAFESAGWKITQLSYGTSLPGPAAENSHTAVVHTGGNRYGLELFEPRLDFPVESIDAVLNAYMESEPGSHIDYVHDEETVREAGLMDDGAGFFLPDFPKDELFPAVVSKGALPRKSFSLGHSREKRYYLEARKITRE